MASLNETLLIARSEYCDFPNTVTNLPSVGSLSINYEKLIQLNPDYVVAVGVNGFVETKLNALSVKNLILENPESLTDIFEVIDELGTFVGLDDESEKLNLALKKRYDFLKEATYAQRKKVLIVLQVDPLIVIGNKSFINDVIYLSGGVNAINKAFNYPKLSLESFLALDIDVIVCGYPELYERLKSHSVISSKLKKDEIELVNTINPDLFLRPGPRLFDGVVQLREVLHGK